MTTAAPASSVEGAWEQLWSRLTLGERFWVGFLFETDQQVVDELLRRATRFLKARLKGVDERRVTAPEGLRDELGWVLGDHDPGSGLVALVATGARQEWGPEWDWLLRRLNEHRDTLEKVVPGGVLFVAPGGLMALAREAAPDLWDYRALVISRDDRTRPGTAPARAHSTDRAPADQGPDLDAFVERALAPPDEPSPALLPVVRRLAAEVQAGRGAEAVDLAMQALDGATSAAERGLAEAWLAQALAVKGDAVAAEDHAQRALAAGVPFGPELARALLSILRASDDRGVAAWAAERLVAVDRKRASDSPNAPALVRALSVSLDSVGRVREAEGDRAAARAAYEESLALDREIDERWGPTTQSRRDLSVSLNDVGRAREAEGDRAAARAAYEESLALAREVDAAWGPTPQSRRDLSVALDHVGRVREAEGDRAAARAACEESLALAREVDAAWGPTPESRRDLSVSLNNVGRAREAEGDRAAARAAYEESLALRREIDERWGPTPQSRADVAAAAANVERLGSGPVASTG